MPAVSVVIPTYNCAEFLPQTIDSVLNQTFKDFEIIIVDDGSVDNTKEIVKHYIDTAKRQIKYIYQENKGPAAARNNGIRNASGKYIALVDSDDLWVAEKLSVQIDYLEKNTDLSFVFSDMFIMEENGKAGDTMMKTKKPSSGYIFYELLKDNFIFSPTPFAKKECFDKAGFFCEDRDIISTEDHHMWLKVAYFFKGGYIDKPLAYYRIRSGSLSSYKLNLAIKDMIVLDKIAAEFPDTVQEGEKYYRESRANLYFEVGYALYLQNDFKKALNYFLLSVRENYLCIKTYKMIIVILILPHSYLLRRNIKRN